MLLLRHGIVGFCLGYGPVLAVIGWLIVTVLRRLKDCMASLRCCSLLYSAVVAFAASMIVGHVIQAPSVSMIAVPVFAHLLQTVGGKEPEA